MKANTAMLNDDGVSARQTAFFAAFVLPIYKLLELPALLARFAAGDLLLPALIQFLLQTGVIVGLLFAASRSEKTLVERLEERLGKWSRLVYGVYALVFLFSAVLPLLDLEKFVYAVFYDTSPTLFSFAAFFLFSAFLCTKGVKALGRIGDLSLFLFLFPFLALIIMSLVEADITNLLPLFEQPFSNTVSGVTYTAPHFLDALFLLPLIGNLRFKKGDGVKITTGYVSGSLFTLLFLAVFYGVYSTVAMRKHYAFAKIAQYFPVLSVVGRIDLIFVYMLCVVLFFYTAIPLRNAVAYTVKASGIPSKTLLSFIVNLGAFLFVLFCNKYYDNIYAFFGNYAFPFVWVFANLLPLLLLLLGIRTKKENKENSHA
ncbi:MAG: GerAB/ArcD/ProY family transporter [Clostridia bacterium]|nr:GerAB/ArcD/ProY family transporter [Clostridia bacterium]